MPDVASCSPQIWSRRARDFIAFSIVVSLVAGVVAIVAGAIVSRCAVFDGREPLRPIGYDALHMCMLIAVSCTGLASRSNHWYRDACCQTPRKGILLSRLVVRSHDVISHVRR